MVFCNSIHRCQCYYRRPTQIGDFISADASSSQRSHDIGPLSQSLVITFSFFFLFPCLNAIKVNRNSTIFCYCRCCADWQMANNRVTMTMPYQQIRLYKFNLIVFCRKRISNWTDRTNKHDVVWFYTTKKRWTNDFVSVPWDLVYVVDLCVRSNSPIVFYRFTDTSLTLLNFHFICHRFYHFSSISFAIRLSVWFSLILFFSCACVASVCRDDVKSKLSSVECWPSTPLLQSKTIKQQLSSSEIFRHWSNDTDCPIMGNIIYVNYAFAVSFVNIRRLSPFRFHIFVSRRSLNGSIRFVGKCCSFIRENYRITNIITAADIIINSQLRFSLFAFCEHLSALHIILVNVYTQTSNGWWPERRATEENYKKVMRTHFKNGYKLPITVDG